MSDSTGVIPEPAAMATWCRAAVGCVGQVNDPIGVITSISSPAATDELSHVDIRPPSTTAEATRSCPMPSRPDRGWQIEYDCRTSSPSIVARRVRCCPGRNAYSSHSSRGTANVTATASSVSRSTPDTCSGWNRGRRTGAAGVNRAIRAS